MGLAFFDKSAIDQVTVKHRLNRIDQKIRRLLARQAR